MMGAPSVSRDLRLEQTLDGGDGALFSACGRYRYHLWRCLDARNLRTLLFLMLNPSKAGAFRSDHTITRCVGYGRRERVGYVGAVNMYAWIETDSAKLLDARDPIGPRNDDVIRRVLGSVAQRGGIVCAAWGASAIAPGRRRDVLRMVREAGVDLVCLGTTKNGEPVHPLRQPAAAPLIRWTEAA